MKFEIASIQWEQEDKLPNMEAVDLDHLYEYSKVENGVRWFPYISIYSNTTGEETRHYLGA